MFNAIKQFLYHKLPETENHCKICFSSNFRKERRTYDAEVSSSSYLANSIKNKTMFFEICEECGFSFCKENFKDYVALGAKSMSSAVNCKRVGGVESKGREYFMANDAIAILRKEKLRVLVFAPGNSEDHISLRNLDSVVECKITDLKNFQSSEYFIPLDSKEVFDIVIACEVVEHFVHPRKEFANLFRYLKRDGLLILSTNTREEGLLVERMYPFLHGHTSYYSGKSLIFLAGMNDIFIDFRTPEGETFKSKTKRYIYMTKSKNTHLKIIDRFSTITHPMAE